MSQDDTVDRERLRVLLAASTPRPWRAERYNCFNDYFVRHTADRSTPIESTGTSFGLGMAVGVTSVKPDAALIAAAVNALPELLDAIDKTEADVLRWKKELAEELGKRREVLEERNKVEAERDALRDRVISLEGDMRDIQILAHDERLSAIRVVVRDALAAKR